MSNIDLMDARAKEAHSATVKWVMEIVTIYAKSLNDVGLTISEVDESFIIRESMKAARSLSDKIIKDMEERL